MSTPPLNEHSSPLDLTLLGGPSVGPSRQWSQLRQVWSQFVEDVLTDNPIFLADLGDEEFPISMDGLYIQFGQVRPELADLGL